MKSKNLFFLFNIVVAIILCPGLSIAGGGGTGSNLKPETRPVITSVQIVQEQIPGFIPCNYPACEDPAPVIEIKWQHDNSNGTFFYDIERRTTGSPWQRVNQNETLGTNMTASGATASFKDYYQQIQYNTNPDGINLAIGSDYEYRVVAYNTLDGQRNERPSTISQIDPVFSLAPIIDRVEVVYDPILDANTIEVSWIDLSDNELFFIIERAPDIATPFLPGEFAALGGTWSNFTSFVDADLFGNPDPTQGTGKFVYRVRARNRTDNPGDFVYLVSSELSQPVTRISDGDGDSLDDNFVDNCPGVFNPDQAESTIPTNGVGDVCDDDDGDNIVTANDNCPFIANQNQLDNDQDGIGDACDCVVEFINTSNGADGFAGGNGTVANPYLVSTIGQLEYIGLAPNQMHLDDHFELANDIDLACSGPGEFQFIGKRQPDPVSDYVRNFLGQSSIPLSQHQFIGSFDGNGFTLSNLTLREYVPSREYYSSLDLNESLPFGPNSRLGYNDSPYLDHGLFAGLGAGSAVSNLTLSNFDIHGDTRVGALAGHIAFGSVDNVQVVSSKVAGRNHVGILIGATAGDISNFSVKNSSAVSLDSAGETSGSGLDISGVSDSLYFQSANGGKLSGVFLSNSNISEGIICNSIASASSIVDSPSSLTTNVTENSTCSFGTAVEEQACDTSNPTFVVNSTVGIHNEVAGIAYAGDANPGDGICATQDGTCTIRAAVEESNALPGKQYVRIPALNYPVGADTDPYVISASSYVDQGVAIQDDIEIFGDSIDGVRIQKPLEDWCTYECQSSLFYIYSPAQDVKFCNLSLSDNKYAPINPANSPQVEVGAFSVTHSTPNSMKVIFDSIFVTDFRGIIGSGFLNFDTYGSAGDLKIQVQNSTIGNFVANGHSADAGAILGSTRSNLASTTDIVIFNTDIFKIRANAPLVRYSHQGPSQTNYLISNSYISGNSSFGYLAKMGALVFAPFDAEDGSNVNLTLEYSYLENNSAKSLILMAMDLLDLYAADASRMVCQSLKVNNNVFYKNLTGQGSGALMEGGCAEVEMSNNYFDLRNPNSIYTSDIIMNTFDPVLEFSNNTMIIDADKYGSFFADASLITTAPSTPMSGSTVEMANNLTYFVDSSNAQQLCNPSLYFETVSSVLSVGGNLTNGNVCPGTYFGTNYFGISGLNLGEDILTGTSRGSNLPSNPNVNLDVDQPTNPIYFDADSGIQQEIVVLVPTLESDTSFINFSHPTYCTSPVDALDNIRLQGAACDSGAIEFQ